MRYHTLGYRRHNGASGRIALLFSLALGVFTAASSSLADSARTPGIVVQAQSTVEVTPDRATVRARLWEDTPAVDLAEEQQRQRHQKARREARDTLEERAASLIDTLEDGAGIDRDAISAGSLGVHPRRDETRGTGQDNDGKSLTSTRLERPITVQLDDLDRLEGVLGALMAADVNRLDGVTFDLKDRQAATDRALTRALKKARHKAELMADTLESELGRVQHVEETRSPGFSPRMMSASADSRSQAEASAPAMEYRPGTVEIEAGVTAEWTLEGSADADSAAGRDSNNESDSDA
ncbi:SIMPL domain-containing protein [Halomonas piscis]|uniref:SIMPL domain-containing protein n=1 Tax=Halomonas piscis TaxID=3031727 RepID=A0ABY9YXB8_9GAMM|nr:SIMPL domain-containing protein [Halomonas piscis]WNK19257.1 SIMPL domain-containing protein [Halomonas piscis]